MHDLDELRCTKCGKLCAKASSLKRHNYYCRSKPLQHPKSRKRCCEACTRAKIRCDATFPTCSSCASRKFLCQYVDHALANLSYSSHDLGDFSVVQAPMDKYLACVDPVNPHALDVESGLQTDFDFNILSTIGSGNNLDAPPFSEPAGPSLDVAYWDFESIPSLPAEHIDFGPVSPISLQWKPPKVLGRRAVDTPRAQMATAMLSQVIASFPYMMTSKETFPPFIHPRCYDYPRGSNELPEILKDCMELAHMFRTKKRESDKIFWRAVRMEQEKLNIQHETYSNHELQAAAQAMLIYTTMRLIDGESGYDEVEVPLLHSLKTITGHLCRQNGATEGVATMDHGDRHWQAWIFAESRRRLMTMARIMNFAFCMDRAFSYDVLDGFALIPLPSNKVAWETKDESIWSAEYDKCHLKRSMFALTDEGRLVRLRQTAKGIESRDGEWQKWLASQDGFGTLIMLASQLLS